MLRVACSAHNARAFKAARDWLEHCGLQVAVHAVGESIPGSYWGEPEAGLVRDTVHVRADTPLHSLLHEASHALCMGADRRARLYRDAGGDDIEESAVCYLQLCIAREIEAIGEQTLERDMDAWGFSFRAGSTLAWFTADAQDARDWLIARPHLTSLLPATFPSSDVASEAAC